MSTKPLIGNQALILKKKGQKPLLKMVRVKGVEPPRLAALDPKSSVSTSSTIPALIPHLLLGSAKI